MRINYFGVGESIFDHSIRFRHRCFDGQTQNPTFSETHVPFPAYYVNYICHDNDGGRHGGLSDHAAVRQRLVDKLWMMEKVVKVAPSLIQIRNTGMVVTWTSTAVSNGYYNAHLSVECRLFVTFSSWLTVQPKPNQAENFLTWVLWLYAE